jgi:hypothetical protein
MDFGRHEGKGKGVRECRGWYKEALNEECFLLLPTFFLV